MIRFLSTYIPKRTLLLGVSEACLVCLVFVVAAVVRLGAVDAGLTLTYQIGSLKIMSVSVAFVTCMHYFDLYDSRVLSNHREVCFRLVQVVGVAYIALGLVYYLYAGPVLRRDVFEISFLFAGVLILLGRNVFSIINSRIQLAERVLIVGNGPLAQSLVCEIESRPELGMRIEGRTQGANGSSADACTDIYKKREINRIVIAMEERRGKLPVDLLLSLKSDGVRIQDGNEVYEAITGKVAVDWIRQGWLLFSPGGYGSHPFMIYKRFASVLVSMVGLVLSLPLFPLIALAVWVSSPGPVLYRQRRVGCEGRVFSCYKFRTMRANAETDTGPIWAADDDPRITPIGRFLRQTRLDEIPQLWNVLIGDMSLIGPRPERPEFMEELSKEIPYYDLRHSIRPGITGWAQIRYRYGSSIEDAKEKLRYDLFYIKNMSVGLDLLIFFNTIKIILLGRGAR